MPHLCARARGRRVRELLTVDFGAQRINFVVVKPQMLT